MLQIAVPTCLNCEFRCVGFIQMGFKTGDLGEGGVYDWMFGPWERLVCSRISLCIAPHVVGDSEVWAVWCYHQGMSSQLRV